jgi:hypothetical protein
MIGGGVSLCGKGGLALALVLTMGVGCDGSPDGRGSVVAGVYNVGAPCDFGVTINDPAVGGVNPDAPECVSRMCLYPPRNRSTTTGALCTGSCSGDDDCARGERRGTGNGDNRCKEGFVCRHVFPNLASNPLACKPVCVCRDFLLTDDPGGKPATCP